MATKPEPMNHSMVAQCLTRSFAKAEVFQGKNSFTRVSCSRRRFDMGTEELENIAHCFTKHGKEVCKCFYVKFWNNREAVHLSWKCHNISKQLSNTDVTSRLDARDKGLENMIKSYPNKRLLNDSGN